MWFLTKLNFDLIDITSFYLEQKSVILNVIIQSAIQKIMKAKKTDEDIKKMAEISAEAIESGAIGFTTSRTIFHKTSKGDLVPSFDAAGNELIKIAEEIGKTGKVLSYDRNTKLHR